jgi:protein-arginine kinase activator protein McsA
MEIKQTKLVEKEVVEDVLCNKCGESCKDYVDAAHEFFNLNHATITPDFGYGSRLYDMDSWEVHICESCYAEFEATFKIKPKKEQNIFAWG